jgi:hypothetical protein
MFAKENINALKIDAFTPYGVIDKPSIVGASYFIIMKKRCYLKGINHPGYKHGMDKTKLYWIWSGMRQRTTNPHSHNYKYYGAKGIKVCEDWNNPLKFKEWALNHGYKEGLLLDRIDNDKDYCPENCRFVTIEISNRNKRRKLLYGFQVFGNSYGVRIHKNGRTYYGGSSTDLNKAIQLRDELDFKLNYN